MKPRARRPVADRFWEKTELGPLAKNHPELGFCIDWVGNFGSGPYGLFWAEDRMMNSHKWAWEAENGPVPEGLELDHFACDRKSCVEPSHLRPVTHRENTLRSNSKGAVHSRATHCPHGHPYEGDNLYVRPDGKGRGCRTCRNRS